MSENKRYYWLKLQENFFDDDTIDFIESQESGEKYVLFYLKLCLKALKNEGKLIRYVGEMLLPYDDTGLAKITRTDVNVVRSALMLFSKIGLIKKLDTGEIFLTQLNEMVGTETQKAKYMRQKRVEQKGNNVPPMLPECYTEIEIDIDKEKEKDIDIELEKEQEQKQDIDNTAKPKTVYADIFEHYNENYKALYQQRKVETEKPVIFYNVAGKLIKNLLNTISKDDIKKCLDRAIFDDWIVGQGYSLNTILSAGQVNKLLNAKNQTSKPIHKEQYTDEEYLADSMNPDEVSY